MAFRREDRAAKYAPQIICGSRHRETPVTDFREHPSTTEGLEAAPLPGTRLI